MLNGVGSGGARDAIKAAMARQAEARDRMQATSPDLSGGTTDAVKKGTFGDTMKMGAQEINTQLQGSEQLVEGIVTGRVSDFHEIAAQVKQTDLSFKFALAVRNKFIDAYREVMRMSV
jgi:flagellar hook-basal body complex protein FliE